MTHMHMLMYNVSYVAVVVVIVFVVDNKITKNILL